MSKKEKTDLLKFLIPFDNNIKDTVLFLRDFVWDLYPKTNKLIYDNYNALAFGWSLTDRLGHTFCSVAVFRTNKNIHFGFYWGNEIADPKKLLIGNGKQYRYLLVKNKETFPATYIKKLVRDAYSNSLKKVKDINQIKEGFTITKSVSPMKRKIIKPGAASKGK